MGIKRYKLNEAQWVKIAPLLPGKASDPGRSGRDNRLFFNGCLWALRSGAHWQHLPERYGKWKTVHRRFSRWCHAGVWEKVFDALTADRDNTYLMLGRPLRFRITSAQASDIASAPALLKGQQAKAVFADKAYDGNVLHDQIAAMDAKAMISSKRNRKVAIPHDKRAYKHRNQVERCFGRLKHFRGFAARYDRRTIHFNGFVHLAAAMTWIR